MNSSFEFEKIEVLLISNMLSDTQIGEQVMCEQIYIYLDYNKKDTNSKNRTIYLHISKTYI